MNGDGILEAGAKRKTGRFQLPVLMLALVALSEATNAQSYRAIELGTLPGHDFAVATDINNAGQVVGVSGGEAFVWESASGMRPLGTVASTVLINNAGEVAGLRVVDGVTQLFAWVNGVLYHVPGPPGENTWALRALTDNGILLVCGSRCWGVYGGATYDLDALTGASIFAVNEAATLGGTAGTDAFLRYWDGRVLVPWRGATFPNTPGPGSVDIIGPAGHFTGRSGQFAGYGTPDGATSPMGLGAPARGGFALRDINRRGDLVGGFRAHILLPQLDTAFVYTDGRLVDLSAVILSGPSEIRDAVAINDHGSIAAAATVNGVRRAVVLVPTPPAPPANLAAVVNGNVVTLTWSPSPGAEGYIIEAGSAPGTRDLYTAALGMAPSLSTPVPPGRYYVRVRARNASGTSSPSSEIIVEVR